MILLSGFAIDAAVQEDHSFNATVTEFPVETGADVTDHVRAQPIRVTIEGVVTDTPIGTMQQIRSGTTLPSEDALAHLLSIHETREPVTIETSLRTYENMVLSSLSIPRNSQVGDALRFTAAFQQIFLVKNERTTVITSQPRGRKKKKVGNLVLVDLPGVDAITTSTVQKLKDRVTTLSTLSGYRF